MKAIEQNGIKVKLVVSSHCFQRFRERFPKHHADLTKISEEKSQSFSKTLVDFIMDGDEEKSFLNNTDFMLYIYDRYGTDNRMSIRINDGVLFIIRDFSRETKVMTCMPNKWFQISRNNKFSGKKKSKSTATRRNTKVKKSGLIDLDTAMEENMQRLAMAPTELPPIERPQPFIFHVSYEVKESWKQKIYDGRIIVRTNTTGGKVCVIDEETLRKLGYPLYKGVGIEGVKDVLNNELCPECLNFNSNLNRHIHEKFKESWEENLECEAVVKFFISCYGVTIAPKLVKQIKILVEA